MNKMNTKVLLTIIVLAVIVLGGALFPLTSLTTQATPAPAQTSAGNGTYPIQFSDTGWNGPWKLLVEPQSREWLSGATQYSMENGSIIYLPPNQYAYTAYVVFPTWTMISSGTLIVYAQNGTQDMWIRFLPGQMVYIHPKTAGNVTWQSSNITAVAMSPIRGEHNLPYASTIDTVAGLMMNPTPLNGSTEEIELSPGLYQTSIMSEGGVFDGGAYFVVNAQSVHLNISMHMQNSRMDFEGTAMNAPRNAFWVMNVTHYVGVPGITETHFVSDQYLPSFSWAGFGTGYLNFTIIAPKGFILEETNITIYHYNVTSKGLLLGLESNHSMHFYVNETSYNFSFYIDNSTILISSYFIPSPTPAPAPLASQVKFQAAGLPSNKLWQFNLTDLNHTLSNSLNGNEFMQQSWTQKFMNFTVISPAGYHIQFVNATVLYNGKQLNETLWTGGNYTEYNGTVVFLNASQVQNYTQYLSAHVAPSGSIMNITIFFAPTVVHHPAPAFPWWIILLIALLAAVIIIILIWYRRRKNGGKEAAEAPADLGQGKSEFEGEDEEGGSSGSGK